MVSHSYQRHQNSIDDRYIFKDKIEGMRLGTRVSHINNTTKNCKGYKLKNKLNGQLSISQVRRFSLHFKDLIDCSSRTIQIKQYIKLF